MLPRIILHAAVSADGRIDWISPDLGVFYRLAASFGEDATLAGSTTILAALEGATDESLGTPTDAGSDDRLHDTTGSNAGDPLDARPLLVVPDSRGQVRAWRRLLSEPYWRAGVSLCSRLTDQAHVDYLKRTGIELIIAGDGQVDLVSALHVLGDRFGVRTVRVDSGGTLNGALLRAGLVAEVSLLVTPALVGGTSPRSFYRADDLIGPEGVLPLRLLDVQTLADGQVWLRYEVLGGAASSAPD